MTNGIHSLQLLGKPPKTLGRSGVCSTYSDFGMDRLIRNLSMLSLSTEDGARIPVRLAIGEIGDVTGAYWANESMSGKGDGKVIEDW